MNYKYIYLLKLNTNFFFEVWNVEVAECLPFYGINCWNIVIVHVFNFGTLERITSRHWFIQRNWKSIWFTWRNIHAELCRNGNSVVESSIASRERCNLATRNNCCWFKIQGRRKTGPGESCATGVCRRPLFCLGNFSCRWHLQLKSTVLIVKFRIIFTYTKTGWKLRYRLLVQWVLWH